MRREASQPSDWGFFKVVGPEGEQLPPRPAHSSHADKDVLSSSKSSDSKSRYFEALKTSLRDISQGEWNTFEGLGDEDSIGAAVRASIMVRYYLTCYIYLYLILCLIGNFCISLQATLYSLKSLNINATKVANYDKLKAKLDKVVGERERLEGQLQEAIQDQDCYKFEWNLYRGETTKLEDKVNELLSKVTELEVEVSSLKGQLEVEHQRAEDTSKAFYDSEEYAAIEDTNINLGREQVFSMFWRRYLDLDFSFLGQEVVNVIEGFKAKLAEEATPITEMPDDEA